MSQRPLVLVTPSDVVSKGGFPARSVNCNYLQGVAQAGGLPVVVAEPSCLKEYIQIADGLLLTGGVDIDPHCYGQSPIDPPEHYDQPQETMLNWSLPKSLSSWESQFSQFAGDFR